MKIQGLGAVCLLLLLILQPPVSSPIAQTDQEDDVFFELVLGLRPGNPIQESFALYLRQQLALIDIQLEILVDTHYGEPLHPGAGQFDLWLDTYEENTAIPDLSSYYSENSTLGQVYYNLDDSEFQSFLEADVGISTDEIEYYLAEIEQSFDLKRMQEKTRNFEDLFMSLLLFDLPLFSYIESYYNYPGFSTRDNWSINQGFMEAIKLGAYWKDPDITGRTAGLDQLLLSWDESFGEFNNTNPYTGLSSDYLSFFADSLLDIDYNGDIHPSIAYQWIAEDIDLGDRGNVTQGNQTFFINTDFQFPETEIYDGNTHTPVSAHKVDALDVKFTIDFLKTHGDKIPDMYSQLMSFVNSIENITISSTLSSSDTINLELSENNRINYEGLDDFIILPEHILNRTLHSSSGERDVLNGSINPWASYEWQYWSSFSGMSHLGPMRIGDHTEDTVNLEIKENYIFPSIFDLFDRLQENSTEIGQLYDLNLFGTWSPHLNHSTISFWTYADNTNSYSRERPYSSSVLKVEFRKYNTDLQMWDALIAGNLDYYFGNSPYGQELNSGTTIEQNQRIKDSSSHVKLVFNVLNEHLKKRNVRYAIGSAINLTEFSLDFPITPNYSPVSKFYSLRQPGAFVNDLQDLSWYNEFQIPFDIDVAYDLTHINDFRDVPEPGEEPTTAVSEPVDGLISNQLLAVLALSGLIGGAIFLFYRRRYYPN